MICTLWILSDGFVSGKNTGRVYAKEKGKDLWRGHRCPLRFLPKYHQLHHSSWISKPLRVGVSHSKDKETRTHSKSNWRDEKTKIRAIDIDPGKKILPCSACNDANKEMKTKMLEEVTSCLSLRLSPSILHIYFLFQAYSTGIKILFFTYTLFNTKKWW